MEENVTLEEKIYFKPGDIVTIKQDIPNKPEMIVVGKVTSYLRNTNIPKSEYFKGIKCRWFTSEQRLQEAVFNTKDLTLINK